MHGLLLNIPPFKGSAALQFSDVQKIQTTARVRIHVERVIGQVKRRYRILQCYTPLNCWIYQSDMVGVLYVN